MLKFSFFQYIRLSCYFTKPFNMKKIADIFKRKGTNNIIISPDEPVLNALKIMAEKISVQWW